MMEKKTSLGERIRKNTRHKGLVITVLLLLWINVVLGTLLMYRNTDLAPHACAITAPGLALLTLLLGFILGWIDRKKGAVPVLEFDLPETVQAGREEGTQIGEARLIHDGQVLAAVPLVLGETLAQRDYAYELDRVMRSWPALPQSIAE